MRKILNKSIKVLLLVIISVSNFIIPVSSKTIEEVKRDAKKGDIYNPQLNELGISATINAHNYANNKTYEAGDVEVKKVVTKQNDEGLYNVEFYVRGKEGVVTKTKDTYIVFVIDRSYTMKDNKRWEDAKNAVINISKELSNVEGIKMALVGFSGGKASSQKAYDDTVTLRGTFSSKTFTSNEVGNYDDDNWLGGGTNIHAGLLKANELLSGKTGTKYVVLLSDGVPTLYYDNNGYTLGSGNSNTAEKISEVPACKDKAISAAKALKNNGVSIYTIGYHLNELTHNFTYKGVNYNEKNLAIETLKGIATSNSYYYQSDSNTTNTIAEVLKEIKVEITTFPAGYNPVINDIVGPNFKLSNNQNYGGTKTLSKNITITENWQKIGSFNINIDKTVKDGWYKTNNNFTLTYEVTSGDKKEIICTNNPEVYWKQDKFPYIVNYYKDSISDNNLLGSYNDKALDKTIINKEDIDLLKYIPNGYYLDDMYDINISKIDSLIIDKDKENIINILYKIKKFNYTVNYYYADENNNYSDIPDNTKKVKDIDYGTIIELSNHYLKDNEIKEGFILDSNKTILENDSSYIVDRDGIVINIYYNRNNFKYKVNYYFNNVIDEFLTNTSNDLYGSVIYAKDNYLNEELINKNNSDNTTYFLDPNNINNTSNITVSSKEEENVLNIYYIDTRFTDETVDKFTGIDVIDNSKTIIPYTIEYSASINNVRKGDKVTTIITDTLPYEIDEAKSNLNGGIYNKETKTITWTFEEEINNYKVMHNVYKKIEYSVQYKNFADISYSVDNFLINNVNGYTKVNNKQSSGVSDKEDIEVLIKGYVTAIYVAEDSEEKLANNTCLSGLVGDKYETIPKDILGYTLVEEKYPQNSKGKYKEEDIIIKYVYKKNSGEVMHNVIKEGINKVHSINDKIDYNIIVNSNILDYVGNVKLKVIDTLPYKIDESKSKIDDRCKYDGNYEIICEIDYGEITLNDYKQVDDKNIFSINEIFNLQLYYIDIDSNTIENKVTSEIILDNTSDKKEDSFITNIPSGKVIVNYITKDNIKLDDTIIISGLVGTNYETIKKEFDKYSFIEVKGDIKGEIKEDTIEVTYIYDLTPLPPHTGANKNSNIKIFYLVIVIILLFNITIIYKIKKYR